MQKETIIHPIVWIAIITATFVAILAQPTSYDPHGETATNQESR